MKAKITELHEPVYGCRFHSGTTVYTERLRDGRLICASFQDTGIPCYASDEETGVSAFDLQVDGESLGFGWKLADSSVDDSNPDSPNLRMLLRHTLKPLDLEIITLASCCGFFRRRLRLKNTSEQAVLGLTSVSPFAGAIWQMSDNLRENLHDSGRVPYSTGWMQDIEWGYEGNFQWQDVPLNTELSFGSKRGRSGFSTPFAIAHNNVYGGYFVLGLSWSANWRFTFNCEYSRNGFSKMLFEMKPTAPAPMRLIEPGEIVTLPEVHFGLNHESFDDAIQCWHEYLRCHVLHKAGTGKQPVIYNHWGYMQHEMTEAKLLHEIDIASAIGAELFMVDAG